jgi:iron(II)-dependent oxidoreductase
MRLLGLAVCAALAFAPATALGADGWPDLSSPPKAVGGGEHDAAVIVGAEHYAFVAPVPGARTNAEAWQAYLSDTLKVPSDKIALLRDNEATDSKMRRYAAQAAAQVGPGGTLWFVFIGHGAPSKDGKDGLLVGTDAQQDADGLYARSLPRDELLGLLNAGKQAKTVVLIDACFSGRTPSGEALVAGLQPLILTRTLPTGVDARTILMTAAKSDQFAGPLPKSETPRPAFSYLALGALRGWAANADGAVTASALVDFARRALSLDKGRVQTPELTSGAADEVLGHGRETSPDLAKIDRAGAAASGGFQISATAMPASPSGPSNMAQQPNGMDFSGVDVDSLESYAAAMKVDRGDSSPEEKARAWRKLAKAAPKFAEVAGKRAAEWDEFAAQKKEADAAEAKRVKARDADWTKLTRILSLDASVMPDANKQRWALDFLTAYDQSPGLTKRMEQALVPHLPDGPQRNALTVGIDWIRIPGGTYVMGRDGSSGTMTPHRVTLKTFRMAKSPVTLKQYKACVDAGACTSPDPSCMFPRADDFPVQCVDWNQATAFSAWVGGRLPSESEWEYAARSGGKDRRFPWGDQPPSCDRAVMNRCTSSSVAVCSRPAGNTDQGLCDMVGNVFQWVEDYYNAYSEATPVDGSAYEVRQTNRVIRGGLWISDPKYNDATTRDSDEQTDRTSYGGPGFRPVR